MIADAILDSDMGKRRHFSDCISLENGNDFEQMAYVIIGQRHSVNITKMIILMGLFVTCLKWMKND